VGIPAECMVFLLMGGAYLRSRIKQAGKWDQETIVSFFLCQYCSGEYLRIEGLCLVLGDGRCLNGTLVSHVLILPVNDVSLYSLRLSGETWAGG
ncbi:hypothetical protein, partial [Aeromonas sp. PrichA-15]|uniref:hypothetical protein n=1 Tax=Aeromonas sp. PrichA-15 TaxID=2823360 RepID=UPI001B319E81